jgi:hypothetical protein
MVVREPEPPSWHWPSPAVEINWLFWSFVQVFRHTDCPTVPLS